MKNISFLQLVLGLGGAMLIFSGVKNVDLGGFLKQLAVDPKEAFRYAWNYNDTHTPTGQPVKPSSNSTGTTPKKPLQA